MNISNLASIEVMTSECGGPGLCAGAEQRVREVVTASIPLGRYASSDEFGNLMLFLVSDEAGFCTGSTYLVDGGIAAV